MTTELQRAPTLPPFNSSHSMKAMCARQAIEALWQELENCRVHRHRNGNGDTNSSAASTGRCKVRAKWPPRSGRSCRGSRPF